MIVRFEVNDVPPELSNLTGAFARKCRVAPVKTF